MYVNKARKIALMAEDYWIFGCLAERVSTKNTITASLHILNIRRAFTHITLQPYYTVRQVNVSCMKNVGRPLLKKKKNTFT